MKIISIFLFFANILFAGKTTDSSGNSVYTFEVENASMVDSYFNIFNTIASFFQSNDYLELLKIVFLIGGFLVLTISILNTKKGIGLGSLKDFVKYLLIGTFLMTAMFSNKSQIIIKTNNTPSFCPIGITAKESIITTNPTTGVVVGNIPEVLAWTFSLINEVGRETTKLATMGFTAVDANLTTYSNKSDSMSYLEGINTVLNSNISDFTNDFTTTDKTTLIEGLDTLYRDCLAAPAAISGDQGSLVISAISNTGDLRKTLTDYFNSTNSVVAVYLNPTSPDKNILINNYKVNNTVPFNLLGRLNGEILTCGQIWNKVDTILDNLENSDKLICKGKLKDYWNPETMAIFTGDKTLTGSAAGKSIVLNAALANQMYDMKNNIAPGELSFASGKTIASLVHENIGQGFFIAKMLPYLQMGMRAIIYAFFPLVFIVILLPNGISVLKNYLQTLIWIELWTPMAAVLNMFLSIMSTDKFADMYNSDGFNPVQGLSLLSDSAMLAGMGGYLYASVPALTWLLLKNSGQMLSGLGEGLAAKLTANLSSDSILKDNIDIQKHRKVIQDQESKGQKMISLAEMDSLNARHEAWTEAGNFQAKNETINKAYNAGYGKQIDNIITSSAIGELYNGPNGEKFKNAIGLNAQNEIRRNIVELEKTGQIDTHGNINEKEANRVNIGVGTDKAIQTNTTVGTHELNQGRDLNYENKKAEAQAIDQSSKDFALQKGQEIRTGMHDKDPNSTKDKLKEAEIAEMTKIATQLQNETKDQSYFMQKGVFNKDSDGNVVRNGEAFNKEQMQEIMFRTGRFNAAMQDVQDQVNQGKITNHGKADLVKNELITLAKGLGENFAFKEMYQRRLEQMIINKSKDSDKAIKALNMLQNNNYFKSIEFASGVSSLQGVMSDMFNKVQGDQKTVLLNKAGFLASDSSNIKTTEIISDLQAGSIRFDQLTNTLLGMDYLEKVFIDKDKTFSKFQEEARNSMLKEILIQKSIIGSGAIGLMSATTESFNNILNNAEIDKLSSDLYSAQDMGSNQAIKKEVNYLKNIAYAKLGAETVAATRLMRELTELSDNIEDIFDYDNEKPKTKEELERERRDQNRRSKIEELKSKGKLKNSEKNQLRRLESIENKIQNEMKEQSFKDKVKAAISIKGAGQLYRTALSSAGRVGANILAEAAFGSEIVMATEMAGTAVATVGVGTATVGAAIVSAPVVAVASITDNLNTANENIRVARNFSEMANKISKEIDRNTIGTVGSFNISNDPDNKNMIELERSASGNYFIKINNERYETTFTDNEFKNKEYQDSVKEVYFMEALKEATQIGLTKEEIKKELSGAFAIKDSLHNGFFNKHLNSSFAANTMESINEFFH